MKRTATALLLLLFAMTAFAAEIEPKDEKGFTPDRAYNIGDIDSVNVFNGDLVVMFPIGPTYAVGGKLSYGLTLSYNSSVWKKEEYSSGGVTCSHRRPSSDTNAGFGWNLTPTSLQLPCTPGIVCSAPFSTSPSFVSPDGGRHVFYGKLHKDDAAPGSGVTGYTRDGTYVRAKADGNGQLMEFTDGTQQRYEVVAGTNQVRVTDMYDGLGNSLAFTYPTANELNLTDSFNRKQVVRYTTMSSADEENLLKVPSEVELTGFGGKILLYSLNYVMTSIPRTTMYPLKSCYDSQFVTVPLLKSIDVKDKAAGTVLQSWSFSYYGEPGDNSPVEWSGALKTITLPTGGTHTYDYEVFNLPGSACDESSANPPVLRVRSRTVDPHTAYASINGPMTWTYKAMLRPETQTVKIICSPSNQWWDILPPNEMSVTVDTPTSARTVSYFSVWNQNFSTQGANYNFKTDNGLPFTRRVAIGTTRFLSTREFDCSGSSCKPVSDPNYVPGESDPSRLRRSTYVRYERDAADTVNGLNKRMAAQRTVYHDDPASCDPATTCRYTDVDNLQFDGLGHYRLETRTSNFPGAQTRTSFTDYNASPDIYALDSNGNLIGTYRMPSDSLPWNPYVYGDQWEEENGAAAKRTSDFDTYTGLLKSVLIFKKKAAAHGDIGLDTLGHDVYRTFCYTSGNLTNERHYGGDKATLSTLPAACTGTAPNPANGEYEINHTYSRGVRATSSYAGSSLLQLDRTIDSGTGLPWKVRDIAGVEVVFDYDALGRLKATTPRDGAWTEIIYAGPNATYTKPTVFVNERPHGSTTATLTESKYEYDGIGRLWRESRLMPDYSWSSRQTTFASTGLKSSVSEMGDPTQHLTTFSYDWLGRAVKVTAPDTTETTTDYTGSSKVVSHVNVATGKTTSGFTYTTANTTREMDEDGKVVSVTEPNSTKTTYTYDIGGRLNGVCMNVSGSTCGQSRTFNYDNRGFMTDETHPEYGDATHPTGGTMYYDETDSRGHVWRRHVGAMDVDMLYDSLERLYRVQRHADQHALKIFEFATANATGDDAKGKLKRGIRYNWFTWGVAPNLTTANFQVIETYKYGGVDGRVSYRTTEEFDCTATTSDNCDALRTGSPFRKFEQSFAYDQRGATQTLGYPTCNAFACTSGVIAAREVANEYTEGKLTGVSIPYLGTTKLNTLSYLPNGMVGAVQHSNLVTDWVTSDLGMTRPKTLSTTGATNNASCVAPSIAVQPVSKTIQSGSTTLSATVSADTDTTAHPLTYQWYTGTSGNTSNPIPSSNSSSISVAPTTTTSYWMRVWNNCGPGGASAIADTVTATVTVCSPITVTSQPASTSITIGSTPAYLSVLFNGSATTMQWYEGTAGDTTRPVSGGTSSNLVISPTTTTSYWFAMTNTCGTVNSNTATVTVYGPPIAPSGLVATLYEGGIGLTWWAPAPPAGLGHYEVQRAVDSPTWSTVATNLNAATWTQTSPGAGKAYAFRARTVDANGAASPWSNVDIATNIVFTDDPLLTVAQGGTRIKAVHIEQLRLSIDALRRTAGLTQWWTSYPPSGVITAQHVADMRQAIFEARLHFGLPQLSYTYLADYHSAIHREDISELWSGLK